MMKNAPRPTASSTTRVWLPGRFSRRTAWRTAKERARASGAVARTSAQPATCSTSATTREAAAHGRADPPRPGLPARERHERRTDQQGDADAQPVAAARPAILLPEQQRRLDMPHPEQRHEREEQRDRQANADGLEHRRRRDRA